MNRADYFAEMRRLRDELEALETHNLDCRCEWCLDAAYETDQERRRDAAADERRERES